MSASELSHTPSDPSEQHIAIARQAILNQDRAIFGYELFDRSVQADQHTGSTDAQMLFNLLSSSDSEVIANTKTIFINCTHASLAGGHLDLVAPERVVLEIPPLPITEVDQIQNHLTSLQGMQRRVFDWRLIIRFSPGRMKAG